MLRKSLLAAVLAAVGTVGFAYIADGHGLTAYSFFNVLLLGVCGYLTFHFFGLADKRMKPRAFWLGLGFTLSMAIGYQFKYQKGFGGVGGLLWVLATALAWAPAAAYLFCGLYQACTKLGNRTGEGKHSSKAVFWGCAGMLLLCWLPVFLAYYPGLFTYDVHMQIPQGINAKYTALHPLAHTLILGAFYRLGGAMGSHTLGMALYTGVQMIALSLALAYALAYLYRVKVRRGLWVGCLVFFALCPIMSMMAISITKDVLYAALILVELVMLHKVDQKPDKAKEKGFMVRMALVIVATCLIRNNGVLPFALLGVSLFWLMKKNPKLRNRLLAVVLCGLVVYGATSFALVKGLKAGSGKIEEIMNVPLQQVARVYANHQEEIDCAPEIESFLQATFRYTPTFSDPVKAVIAIGRSNAGQWMSIWARLLPRYPLEYAEAFLFNCQGFWFVDDLSQGRHYGVSLERRTGYMMSNTMEGYGVEHTSFFPALEREYERLFSANEYTRYPVVAQVFSLAAYSWLLAFLGFAAAYGKRRSVLLGCVVLLGVAGPLLLGPCALVRYQLPLVMGGPVLFALLFGVPKGREQSPPEKA